MNTTQSWELMLSMMVNTLTYRMERSRQLNTTIRLFAEATDENSRADAVKMTALLTDNLDRMRELVEATGKVASSLNAEEVHVDFNSELAKRQLAAILEMHPDGKDEFP